jgi:hypothetical protein
MRKFFLLKIEKEPTTRPQSEIEIFIFARLDEKFFCCPFALKEKFTPSRSAYATLSASLRRPLTINHNIKRKADDP